jgi:hypothetical protein
MIFVKLRFTLIKSSVTEPHHFDGAMAPENFFLCGSGSGYYPYKYQANFLSANY